LVIIDELGHAADAGQDIDGHDKVPVVLLLANNSNIVDRSRRTLACFAARWQ
jgi:hypothetical protein